MASLAEHEANQLRAPGRPVFVRLLTYVRPYVGMIVVTAVLALAFSGSRGLRAYLMKPIVDDIALPHLSLETSMPKAPTWLPDLGMGGEEEKQAAEPAPPVVNEAQRAELEQTIRSNVHNVVLLALVVIFGAPLFELSRSYLISWVMGLIHIDIQRDVCAKLLALPLRFHHDRRRGDVLSRTMRDVGSAHGSLALVFGDFFESLAMVVVLVGLLFYLSWQLALLSLLVGPLLFGVLALFGRRIKRSARRRQEQLGEVTQRLVEILSGIKIVKAFRAEAVEHRAFRRETRKLFRRQMKAVKNRVLVRGLVDMLNHVVSYGVLGIGLYLVLRDQWGLSLGDLVAFGAVAGTAYKPVKSLARGWVKLIDAQPASDRLFEVLDTHIEIADAPDAVKIDGVHEGVRFDRLSFSYGREPVLEEVSFEARAREVVAIVGRTGAGKTTLVDLLLRFYDPTSGAIEIDGIDLRRIQRDSLLAQIAMVTQEPFLFDGSIRDNIRYGRPGASDEDVMAAARAAYVDEFAGDLPDGYDTLVGAGGVRLSGGQRQRITIARAILKDPAILIFDEATSSLDSQSERYVQVAIEALLGGRTVFLIAHRLSTVRRADKIVVLQAGRVTQVGTHQELIDAGGLYRDLVHLQNAHEPEPAARAS